MSLTPKVAEALNGQGNRELSTSLLYHSLGYWADVRELTGFAGFFRHQAEEEEAHAKAFFKFLADRDYAPTVGPIERVVPGFKDISEVAKLLHKHERENTRLIHALFSLARTEADPATEVFLHPFIAEQVEEEAWTDAMLERVERSTCAGALYNLDRHIMKDLLGDTKA